MFLSNLIGDLSLSGGQVIAAQGVCFLLLLVALLAFFKTYAYEKKVERYVSEAKERSETRPKLNEEQINKMAAMGFKPSAYERFNQTYWVSSGLSGRFPSLGAWILMLPSLVLGVIFGIISYRAFLIEGIAISGFCLGVLTPLQIIEWVKFYRVQKIITELPTFFGILLRWAQINPDVIYCLGKLGESGLKSSIVPPFQAFLVMSQNGISSEKAFVKLESSVHMTILKHFTRSLETILKTRGDICLLLEAFEEEAYQLQMEETKRSSVQAQYKLLINGLSILSFFLIYMLLKTNKVLATFYVETLFGKTLLSGLALLVVSSFIIGLNNNRSEF